MVIVVVQLCINLVLERQRTVRIFFKLRHNLMLSHCDGGDVSTYLVLKQ